MTDLSLWWLQTCRPGWMLSKRRTSSWSRRTRSWASTSRISCLPPVSSRPPTPRANESEVVVGKLCHGDLQMTFSLPNDDLQPPLRHLFTPVQQVSLPLWTLCLAGIFGPASKKHKGRANGLKSCSSVGSSSVLKHRAAAGFPSCVLVASILWCTVSIIWPSSQFRVLILFKSVSSRLFNAPASAKLGWFCLGCIS